MCSLDQMVTIDNTTPEVQITTIKLSCSKNVSNLSSLENILLHKAKSATFQPHLTNACYCMILHVCTNINTLSTPVVKRIEPSSQTVVNSIPEIRLDCTHTEPWEAAPMPCKGWIAWDRCIVLYSSVLLVSCKTEQNSVLLLSCLRFAK